MLSRDNVTRTGILIAMHLAFCLCSYAQQLTVGGAISGSSISASTALSTVNAITGIYTGGGSLNLTNYAIYGQSNAGGFTPAINGANCKSCPGLK